MATNIISDGGIAYYHRRYKLTRQEKTVTELRNLRVNIAPKRSTTYAGTHNSEIKNEPLVQPPTTFGKDGVMKFRNWSTRPQPTARKSQLGEDTNHQERENSPSEATVVTEGMIHMYGFLL